MNEELQHPLDIIAIAAYEGYKIASDGKSLVDGATLPEWGALRPEIREAWRAAADAAVMAGTLVTPAGYQGPAAHTYTAACAGHHPIAEPCPPAVAATEDRAEGGVMDTAP